MTIFILNLQITRSNNYAGHTQSELSAWWLHMVTLIFLRGLCGYVLVDILPLSPPRVLTVDDQKNPLLSVKFNIILEQISKYQLFTEGCAFTWEIMSSEEQSL